MRLLVKMWIGVILTKTNHEINVIFNTKNSESMVHAQYTCMGGHIISLHQGLIDPKGKEGMQLQHYPVYLANFKPDGGL